jgi:O-6-methylguanine DNA methyltransferase
LATAVKKPASACRAVGQANGRNRIVILIPCHRVVNKDGSLGGYGGGLWRKKYLLELERKHAGRSGGPSEPRTERNGAQRSGAE